MVDMNLRSGIFLAPFHNTNDDPTLAIRRDLDLVEHLDRLGFEEAWVGEHHSAGFEIISSPEMFLAAAGERTKRIRLGTGVMSLPYHNPLMAANRIVQLDHMTMGRVMFGVGPGLLTSDAMMLGIDPLTQRDRMMQSLDVILRLFRGETVTEKTDWYDLRDARLHLLPFTRPHPEIAVASSITPSGGRAAGRYDLGMLCVAATQVAGFDALATNWQVACEAAARHGRTMDPAVLRLVAPIHIAETRAQAEADVEYGLAAWLDYFQRINPARLDTTAAMTPVQAIVDTKRGIIGTPDDCIALIERLQEKQGSFGAFLMLAHNWANWDATKKSYELYARHVLPHFRAANRNRVASLDWVVDNQKELFTLRADAAKAMFDKHAAEEAARTARAAE